MSVHTDIVIVGGGIAGMSAALTALEAGMTVLLLESQSSTGGSSAMSGGCLAFAGTDMQAASGIDDNSDLLYSDLMEVGKGESDPELVRLYADGQLDAYEWLRGHGVSFSPIIEAASGQSVPRVHTVDPADVIRLLEARARTYAGFKIMLGARARRLVLDEAQAHVVGVSGESVDGEFNLSAARGVVLASGGFGQDRDLIHRFAPLYDHAVFISGAGSWGDGLRMAWKLGADLRDMVHIKGTYGKHPVDETNHHSCLAVYKGAIAVNQDGHRFVDESLSYKLLGDASMMQPYGVTYQILDQGVMDAGDNRVRILDFERRLEEGLFVVADTLAELAEHIEIPAETLIATVERYNANAREGRDPDFGRRHLVHNHGSLRPIENGPFYAYPSTAAVFGTYCGLRVDSSMRVIDVFGEAIPGLYAAGEVVGGFHGMAYMTGSALGKALVFGRTAATTLSDVGRRDDAA